MPSKKALVFAVSSGEISGSSPGKRNTFRPTTFGRLKTPCAAAAAAILIGSKISPMVRFGSLAASYACTPVSIPPPIPACTAAVLSAANSRALSRAPVAVAKRPSPLIAVVFGPKGESPIAS